MYETAGTEPRHTNNNPVETNNVGAIMPEDPKNKGDGAMSHYVYRSGRRKRQGAEASSHRTTVAIPRREEQASRNPRVPECWKSPKEQVPLQHIVQMRKKTRKEK